MLTVPNMITLFRIPLALAFLHDSILWRVIALLLAMLSDGLDGYFARRLKKTSRIGTFLDPFSDKFFVFFVLTIFINENRISVEEAATMLCRDFSVILFGFYLAWKGTLGEYQFRAIWCGKITTAMQFIVLLGLSFQIIFPPFVYFVFIVIGLCALSELYLERTKLKIEI